MQVFEIYELKDFPYMITQEMANLPENTLISDVIQEEKSEKVYIIIDHNSKRIWTYNGLNSSFKLQIYGGILAGMFRKQLRLFYRIYSLNKYTPEDEIYRDLMNKSLLPGIAKDITEKDFSETAKTNIIPQDLSIHPGLKIKSALEDINELPVPNDFIRKFLITGVQIYTDEEIIEKFIPESVLKKKQTKLGRLNDGFTFFDDNDYSTRLLINKRCIQGIELFVNKDKEKRALNLKIPVIYDEKFNTSRDINSLKKAFQIPE